MAALRARRLLPLLFLLLALPGGCRGLGPRRSFRNFFSREPMRRMHEQEVKAELSLDRMQLESIHKVRFSPNLDSHGWLVSGGQSGIVRAHCLVGLTSPVGHKLLQECRAQFSAMYGDRPESPSASPAEHGLLQEQ